MGFVGKHEPLHHHAFISIKQNSRPQFVNKTMTRIHVFHYNADCPPCSGWRKWRGQSFICPFKPKLLLSTGGGSDACIVHGGGLLLEFGDGAYGGLWAFGGRFSGPGAYLSLTLGCAAWELAVGHRPTVSWPNRAEQYLFRLRARAWGADDLGCPNCCGLAPAEMFIESSGARDVFLHPHGMR